MQTIMTSSLILITPTMAKAWLAEAGHNRRVNQAVVIKYAGDMKDGLWTLTHQGIAFDENGRLIDGQHRLHAIIMAGFAVMMMVTKGISVESLATIDIMAPRRSHDISVIAGDNFTDPRQAMALARMLMYLHTNYSRGGNLSVTGLRNAALRYRPAVEWAAREWNTRRAYLDTVPVMAAFAFAWPTAKAEVELFAAAFRTGDLSPRRPMFVLRERLLREAKLRKGSGCDVIRQQVARLMLSAISAELGGAVVSRNAAERDLDGLRAEFVPAFEKMIADHEGALEGGKVVEARLKAAE